MLGFSSPPMRASLTERLRLVQEVLADAGFKSILPALPSVEIAVELPAVESVALAAVGLRADKHTQAQATRARMGYVLSFVDLLRQSDTPRQVAERLGLDSRRVRQRIREGSLLAVELNDKKRVPLFQFEGDMELPGLGKILKILVQKMTPLAIAIWFMSPTPDLGDANSLVSPRDWLLRTGKVGPVLALAELL